MDRTSPTPRQAQAYWVAVSAASYRVTVILTATDPHDAAQRALGALHDEYPNAATHESRTAVYSYQVWRPRRCGRSLLFILRQPPKGH